MATENTLPSAFYYYLYLNWHIADTHPSITVGSCTPAQAFALKTPVLQLGNTETDTDVPTPGHIEES